MRREEKLKKEIESIGNRWDLTTSKRGEILLIVLPRLLKAKTSDEVVALFKVLNESKLMHERTWYTPKTGASLDRVKYTVNEKNEIVRDTGADAGPTSSVMFFVTQLCIGLMQSFNASNEQKREILNKPLTELRDKVSKDYTSPFLARCFDTFAGTLKEKGEAKARDALQSESIFVNKDKSGNLELAHDFQQYVIKFCGKYFDDPKSLDDVLRVLKSELEHSSKLSQLNYPIEKLFEGIKNLPDQVSLIPRAKAVKEIEELRAHVDTIMDRICRIEYGYTSPPSFP